MPSVIDEVSERLGELSANMKLVLDNQEIRQRIDADFRREVRDNLSKLAPVADLVRVEKMAAATKAKVDRAAWSLSAIVLIVSVLWEIFMDKIHKLIG